MLYQTVYDLLVANIWELIFFSPSVISTLTRFLKQTIKFTRPRSDVFAVGQRFLFRSGLSHNLIIWRRKSWKKNSSFRKEKKTKVRRLSAQLKVVEIFRALQA